MRLSVDTGGTFTDLVVEDPDGTVTIFKRPTTPHDPALAILDVVDAAAEERGVTRPEFLSSAQTFIHATTHALNALLTNRIARTALLTSAGHRDVLVLREGGREHFNVRAPYPDPFIPRSLTFEIEERIIVSGSVLTPLDVEQTREVLHRLGELEVEAVAVCLLWSIVNPTHELAVGEFLERELPGVPYTLSHRLVPSLREYRRASATAMDAALKPLMSRYLSSLSRRLSDSGFAGRLLMVASNGALLDIDEVAGSPIHSIKSGPAMAPVAGRIFAQTAFGQADAIVTDTGGTSYDVSAVLKGAIPWTRETWLGTPYLSHMTGFPSVDVKSHGAGGGSIAWVDRGGLLHVGPDSAGADPGPVAYGRGGESPTFTDAAVVLGLIDPNDFLGGRMRLDAEAARSALLRNVGAPLGLDAVEAASSVLEVMTEQMARAIEDTALRQGVDPTTAVLVGGGGAAGLNVVGVARLIGCTRIVVPAVSAALSAAGALLSDLGKDFVVTFPVRTSNFDHAAVRRILADLQDRATSFLDDVAAAGMRGTEFFAEGHYVREVWEIEVPLQPPLDTASDLERLRGDFHRRHDQLYAVSEPDADLEIIAFRARAWCQPASRAQAGFVATKLVHAPRMSNRPAYFGSRGWLDTALRAPEQLSPGDQIEGPAIVTSSVTTIVVDPDAVASIAPDGSLTIALSRDADDGRPTGVGSSALQRSVSEGARQAHLGRLATQGFEDAR